MRLNVPQAVYELSAFISPLYVVGGYVRNALLGAVSGTDIDLAAPYTPDEVTEMLQNSGFSAVKINKRLGTLKISGRGADFEYTCFRTDSYPQNSGAHRPEKVSFVRDIGIDALRRDFTINALYYDITRSEVIDLTGGCEDLAAKRLHTVRTPDEVFGEDALRIMRLARLAAELGFDIESESFESARRNAPRLKDIAPQRITDELTRILNADGKYPEFGLQNAHARGLYLLSELGALQVIIPEFAGAKGSAQNPKFHAFDVLTHTFKAVEYSPPEVRLAALFHDIAKPMCAARDGNVYSHSADGEAITRERLGKKGLNFPQSVVDETARLVRWHMYDGDGKTGVVKVRRFLQQNEDILEKLLALKRADARATKDIDIASVGADALEKIYGKMKAENIPFRVAQLKVGGADLIEIGIPEARRAEALKKVLAAAADGSLNTREKQLNLLRRMKNGMV